MSMLNGSFVFMRFRCLVVFVVFFVSCCFLGSGPLGIAALSLTMMDSSHPYSALTPDCALDALDSTGLWTDGRLLALNSYETRVYQMGVEDAQPVVVKFYRPGRWRDDAILEEHVYTQDLAEREIPVVAPLRLNGATLHLHAVFRFAFYPKQGGRMPEFDRADALEWMGRFLGRIHAVGATADFVLRPALDLETFGYASHKILRQGRWLPADLIAAWDSVVEHALASVAHCYARAGAVRTLRLHGDCHAGNVLWTEAGPHFVDLDDARMGPAVQDLWMLLSGERAQRQKQLGAIVDGCEQLREFDRAELALIDPLRTLRLIHYSAWLARRWADPIFPNNFPWFGTSDYWQGQVQMLDEQIEQMAERPLVA